MDKENLSLIKKMISEGNLLRAIELMVNCFSSMNNEKQLKEILLQESSFRQVERDYLKGIISYDIKKIENTRITLFLLEVLNETGPFWGETNQIKNNLVDRSKGLELPSTKDLFNENQIKLRDLRLLLAKCKNESERYLIKEEILERNLLNKYYEKKLRLET